ncbi:hypothetical protein SC663_09505 [Legionella pneumophila serogroup 1]|uniref:Lipoprotein n=1 Tax=Fluoribacter dumoffii TaxID=463 RepID=A0A377GB78_9GAMM|nr:MULTISPECIES: hypothetical protein [Legionellaceae]KTC92774.1 hypothetical protein Ldum_0090 [Fluoribacter dumoffii NY 23]MDW9174454.1 hypothetical protein [Legionella pneumophila]SNV18305.1 Uncharacterised protein [Legionella pneumophila]STO22065.1 Uncharacterised protein [Fluoribacter dumoffii]HAT4425614.1 hypothetical protein [Legionella pneumophila]
MPTQRFFKAVIGVVVLLSSTFLFTSCSPSTTTNDSHRVSHTYEGHNIGGKGWH